jgi:hypothetical protein
VCFHHKGDACVLETKFPVIAYAENEWLIMFFEGLRKEKAPNSIHDVATAKKIFL